ncbi:hypothetical protein [Acidithiobacillus ferriphilus]|uniref:Uncharacterized protein n=1 Tax=Acidithiobacillus ferriphilus TaxID=1689834 RepID=A0ABU6FU32_9PROT|nr:hypothetical protein [Acidithiobacillus ferriphilus]MEB8485682.1 hypothetical protein [Acidithiobacillus ferriphilus]MEB8490019.1 hypothetical protein [Acidithiobacillus ferriphilus]MEB8494204.1 hypothetical protein [Acidithiobacillus ferriphilus]MEB8515596.1 hypothetical protein [Acidithiobacillus ferriphilus]MEB8521119.1 hypothetical protein [Acidithiobacillus ferriphilus]
MGGAITPTPEWRHYADPEVAPLRRSQGGAITPTTVWLHIADP